MDSSSGQKSPSRSAGSVGNFVPCSATSSSMDGCPVRAYLSATNGPLSGFSMTTPPHPQSSREVWVAVIRGGPGSAFPPQASVTRVSAPHLCPTNSCGAPQAIRFGLVEDSMGLYVHSIGELPTEAYRSYYVYLLDYGWDETFGEAVRSNLPRMADAASRSDAVVIHGPRGMHFEDEVLSWHDINGS